jgi:predicted adenylyl cyclase CyaB
VLQTVFIMFEVEVKSLISNQEDMEKLKERIDSNYPDKKLVDKNRQLNHYFDMNGSLEELAGNINGLVTDEALDAFYTLAKTNPQDYSLRTRLINGNRLILVLKIAGESGDSQNGSIRREFEAEITGVDMEGLDKIVLGCGFGYLSKWSREREEYELQNGLNICLDKNAGYGYLVEVEKIGNEGDSLEDIRQEALEIMEILGLEELDSARLGRMFKYYNQNWVDYYGTDKTFVID